MVFLTAWAWIPLLIVLAIFVRVKLGRGILFIQERPGYKGKIFKIFKFRTMLNSKDKDGNLLPDELRMTRFGKFLRSSSLDELPELINVLMGQMSLVGPRPLLVQYLPLYTPEQATRHNVLPGITGWAQINGRNNISWDDKLAMDAWYVKNRSFLLDMKILFLTFWNVIKRKDISKDGHATCDLFTGKNSKN